MALEAVQAQAGHRSIESTRLYVHLANEWLADEYTRALQAFDGIFVEAVPEVSALAEAVAQREPGALIGPWGPVLLARPQMAATADRYLAQLSVSLRPASVKVASTALRQFCFHVIDEHPEVECFSQVHRRHVESFKVGAGSSAHVGTGGPQTQHCPPSASVPAQLLRPGHRVGVAGGPGPSAGVPHRCAPQG